MADKRHTPVETESIDPQICTLHLRLRILQRTPFFAALTSEELAEINRLYRERAFAAGQTIYDAGEPATRLYVVATGKVKVIRLTPHGQNVLLDILPPGEFFGSLSTLGDREYPSSAEAHTACCVLSVSAEEFQAILHRHPPVALAVLDMVAARLHEAHELIEQYSGQSIERRLASLLLKLGDKMGEQRDGALLIQMPLSRQDLADMAGTTVETASRIMSQFRKDGLIQSGRRWVALADRARLAAIARDDGVRMRSAAH